MTWEFKKTQNDINLCLKSDCSTFLMIINTKAGLLKLKYKEWTLIEEKSNESIKRFSNNYFWYIESNKVLNFFDIERVKINWIK